MRLKGYVEMPVYLQLTPEIGEVSSKVIGRLFINPNALKKLRKISVENTIYWLLEGGNFVFTDEESM